MSTVYTAAPTQTFDSVTIWSDSSPLSSPEGASPCLLACLPDLEPLWLTETKENVLQQENQLAKNFKAGNKPQLS